MNVKLGAFLFALGLVIGIGISFLSWNKQVTALKTHADSVAVVAQQATARADSEHAANVILVARQDTVEQHAKFVATEASKKVAAFHDALHQALAGNTQLSALFDSSEAAHAEKETALQNAVTAADAKVAILQRENLDLLGTVHNLNGQVQDLNRQIAKLHAPPSIILGTLKWVERGLAVKGAVDVVRGR